MNSCLVKLSNANLYHVFDTPLILILRKGARCDKNNGLQMMISCLYLCSGRWSSKSASLRNNLDLGEPARCSTESSTSDDRGDRQPLGPSQCLAAGPSVSLSCTCSRDLRDRLVQGRTPVAGEPVEQVRIYRPAGMRIPNLGMGP